LFILDNCLLEQKANQWAFSQLSFQVIIWHFQFRCNYIFFIIENNLTQSYGLKWKR
jgi:hypothetical protein